MCLEMYELNSACFLNSSGLVRKQTLKNAKVKLGLLTDMNMLLMVKNVSWLEHTMLFINMRKVITNISEIIVRIKNDHILSIRTST